MSNNARQRAVHECVCRICQVGEDQALVMYHTQLNLFMSRLSEPQRRWYAAMLTQAPLALSASDIERITGVTRNTIRRGREEWRTGLPPLVGGRQRAVGGGRLHAEKKIRS